MAYSCSCSSHPIFATSDDAGQELCWIGEQYGIGSFVMPFQAQGDGSGRVVAVPWGCLSFGQAHVYMHIVLYSLTRCHLCLVRSIPGRTFCLACPSVGCSPSRCIRVIPIFISFLAPPMPCYLGPPTHLPPPCHGPSISVYLAVSVGLTRRWLVAVGC